MIEKIKTITACAILLLSVMLFSFLLQNEPKHTGAGLLSPIVSRAKKVADTEPPTIEMKKAAFLDVKNYDELKKSFRVKDNISQKVEVSIDGEVDFNKNGFYVITVTASDESGNITTKDFGIQIYTNLLIISENTEKPTEYDYSIYENNVTYDTFGDDDKIKSITLSNHTLVMYDNSKTTKITAKISPDKLSTKALTWTSSNTNVAIVSNDGYVTPISAGTTIITASGDNAKDTCTVTVKKSIISVTSITLDKKEINLYTTSKGYQLKATVSPSNATNKTVTWKSDNKAVATVSSSGYVTPIGIGKTTITAEADGKTVKCTVNVTRQPIAVSAIQLDKKSLNLIEGEKEKLSSTITPANADDKTTTWTSSNTKIATVDSYGWVTAKSAGTVTITATAGGKKATCAITVSKATDTKTSTDIGDPGVAEDKPVEDKTIKVTLITLDKNNISMYIGNTTILTATINPSNATNKGITWKSTNTNVVTVNSSGVVTAKGAGSAMITATADGKTASCSVTVRNKEVDPGVSTSSSTISVESVELNHKTLTLKRGSQKALMVSINPSTATNQDAKWYTSNSFVATVSNNGVIKALAPGTATITVIVDGKRDTCEVEVTENNCSGTYTSEERNTLIATVPYKYGVKLVKNQKEVVYKYSSNCELVVYSTIETKYDRSGYNATTQDLIPEAREVIKQNTELINTVLNRTNEYRIEANAKNLDGNSSRPQLVLDDKLTLAATVRALEMAYSGVFEHTRPNGTKWSTAILECGSSHGFLGENIARGYETADGVSKGWKNSPSHYENMVRPAFTRIGIGYFKIGNTPYWAQEFNNKE